MIQMVSKKFTHRATLIGPLLCVFVSTIFAVLSDPCNHWFILPVTLCGIILVKEAQAWIVGKIDLFDPKGVIAILGMYFFYIAPILHVYWDSWMLYVVPPTDWRPWLGYMALLNFLGLVIFKCVIQRTSKKKIRPLRKQWRLNHNRFWIASLPVLALTLVLQIYIYQIFGGVEGYIKAYEEKGGDFTGMGWLFMISENFPIIAFMAYAVAATRYELLRRWKIIALSLLMFFALKMIFGGLRGSRGNTIWGMFWAAGIIHYWVRPLNRKIIIAGLVVMVGFMYSYGLYKSHGSRAFQVMSNPLLHSELADESGRTFDKILLGDLARSDVQAFLLYRLTDEQVGSDYQYKWGVTYLRALSLIAPSFIRPLLPGKREAGTEAQYGRYFNNFLSSRIYGLAGETILNWSILGVPFAFLFYGFLVSRFRQFMGAMHRLDARVLLIPFSVNFLFMVLVNDIDNLIYFIISKGAVPICLVWVSATMSNLNYKRN